MEKSVQELIFDLESPIEEVRKFAVIWLAQVGDAAVVPLLRRSTKDPSTAVRYFARRAIDDIERRTGQHEPRPSAPEAEAPPPAPDVRARMESDDAVERGKAAGELARTDDPALLALARHRLEVESDGNVRTLIVKAIARLRLEEDVPLLLKSLGDSDASVRAEAVLALEPFIDEKIAGEVAQLASDPDNRTRANALLALSRFDEPRAMEPLSHMATAPEIWMRDSAVFVLRSIRSPRAVELLGRMHRDNSKDAYLFPKIDKALTDLAQAGHPTAIRVLGSLHQGRFESELVRLDLDRVLDALDEEIRGEGRPRVRRIKRYTIVSFEEFQTSLESPDHERRLSAADAGRQFDHALVREAFRRRLAVETHPFVLSKLGKELGRVGTDEDVGRIAKLLAHEDARVRANAVEGLGFLGVPEIYDHVRPLLDDPSGRVKANAARIVMKFDRERAFRTLKEMILSRQPGISESAIHALGEVYTDDVLELVELALTREDQEVKLKVLKVLQTLADRSAVARKIYGKYREEGDMLLLRAGDVESIGRAASDPDPKVRLEAIGKLRVHPDSRARTHLERLGRDSEPLVRWEARRAHAVWELERDRLAVLYQIGGAVYRAMRAGHLAMEPALAPLLQSAQEASANVDQGSDPSRSLAARTAALWALAQKALEQKGAAGLANIGCDELLKRIDMIQHQIKDRLIQVSATMPQPRDETAQAGAGGGTAGGSSGVGVGGGGGPGATPFEARQDTIFDVLLAQNRMLTVGGALALAAFIAGMIFLRMGATTMAAGWHCDVESGIVRQEVGQGTILIINGEGHPEAISGSTGQRLWRSLTVSLDHPFQPLVEGSSFVLGAPDGTLMALDAGSGQKLWQAREPGLAQAPARGPRGLVVLTGGDRPQVAVLNASTGAVVETTPAGDGIGRFALPTANGLLLGRDRNVRLLDVHGNTQWQFSAEEDLSGDPPPFELGSLTVVRARTHLHALGRHGEKVWDITITDKTQVFPPTTYRRQVVLVDGRLVTLLDAGGKIGSHFTLAGTPAAVATYRGFLYYATPEGTIQEMSLSEGVDRMLYDHQGDVRAITRVGGVLFVATSKGISGLLARPATP